jgi:hypothetical protein
MAAAFLPPPARLWPEDINELWIDLLAHVGRVLDLTPRGPERLVRAARLRAGPVSSRPPGRDPKRRSGVPPLLNPAARPRRALRRASVEPVEPVVFGLLAGMPAPASRRWRQSPQVDESDGQREMRYLLGFGALQEVFGLTPT